MACLEEPLVESLLSPKTNMGAWIWTNHTTSGTISFEQIRPKWSCLSIMHSTIHCVYKSTIRKNSLLSNTGPNWVMQHDNHPSTQQSYSRMAEEGNNPDAAMLWKDKTLKELWMDKSLQPAELKWSSIVKIQVQIPPQWCERPIRSRGKWLFESGVLSFSDIASACWLSSC